MIEVDSCPNCRGMWLDFNELDKLEDVVFDDDAHKGSLVHFQSKQIIPARTAAQVWMNFNIVYMT